MAAEKRTPEEWFHEAARCYVEHHQGCAWCGGAHRIYQVVQEEQVTYYCYTCDFRTGYDKRSGKFFSYPGVPIKPLSTTMVAKGR